MTGSEKVFFDTSPFIYLLENHSKYYLPVAEFITVCVSEKQAEFVTSVLTIAEFGAKPRKTGKLNLLKDFENLTSDLKFQFLIVDKEIASFSSTLRADYGLKGIDSLLLSTAIRSGANEFLTNDKNLKRIKEIKITLIEDLL